MAMKFMDGFDYLITTNNGLKWDSAPIGTLLPGVYGNGKCINLGTGAGLTKTLPTNFVTGMMGFHFSIPSIAASRSICAFLDAGVDQVDLRTDTTGALFFTRNGTTIGSVSTFRITPNQFYWCEVKVTVDPSAGVASLFINATAILTQTGLNTRASANSFFNQVILVGNNGNSTYDSFHFWDTSAGDVNGFPYGEHLIDTELAVGAGSHTDWSEFPATGANFNKVNEPNEDGDATYVFSATPNQIDSYQFANLRPTGGTIGTIAINTIDRDDDATPRTFDHYSLSGGSSNLSAPFTPGSNYINHQSFVGTDPNTGSAWTVSGRNAAEFGYKEIS